MSRLHLLKLSSNDQEYIIEGVTKRFSNWMAAAFIVVYFIALMLLFPPIYELSVLLWLYCAIFMLLIVYSPKWWLWSVIITVCTLGFVSNLYGVFNKDVIDGSFLSIAHLQQIQTTGLKGRVFSLPLLGLPPSILVWWLRERKVFVPKTFIPIAVLCIVMVISSIVVCLNYIHISWIPPDFTIIVPESLEKMPYARQWWQTGMPYTLMAFTITLTFAGLMGSILLIVVLNLLRSDMKFLNSSFSALTISAIISVMYGLAQMKGMVPVFTSYGRLESTFQSQGSYGVFVGISCVFLFNRFFLSDDRKIVYAALLIISLLGLFINQSRTAFMALIINPFIIYVGYLIVKHKGIEILKSGKRRFIIPVMVGILILISAFSIPSINHIVTQNCHNSFILRTVRSFDIERGGISDSLSGRFKIWEKCFEIWDENPLLGCGQGQLYWELRKKGASDTAANQFILVLGELGIIGFGIFLWVIISLFKDFARPIFLGETAYGYSNWLICCSLVVCILVQSLTIHVLHFPNLPLLIGIIVAMALACSRPRPELSENNRSHSDVLNEQ